MSQITDSKAAREPQAARLTDRKVAALKPADEAYRVTDAAGLFLMVLPSGAKVWRCIYITNGKRTLLKLGEYPAMTLAEARLARQQVRLDVQAGGDPSRERNAAKQARMDRNAQTFEPMVRAWHAANAHRWGEGHGTQVLQRLVAHAVPAIGALPVHLVKRSDIVALLRRVRDASGPFAADHLRKHLVACFNSWLDDEHISKNPADRLAKDFAAPRGQSPQPAVTELDGVRHVLTSIEASGIRVMLKLLHRFQALTGARPSEAREARWDEFSVRGEWRIPGERMKQGHAHTVYLSEQAQAVIDTARALVPDAVAWVFPSGSRAQPYGRVQLCRQMGAVLGNRVHVAHGWRAALRTCLGRLHRRDRDLIEVMLAHQTKGQVERLYDRTSGRDFEADLRALWQEWADLLLEGAPSARALAGLERSNVVVLQAPPPAAPAMREAA